MVTGVRQDVVSVLGDCHGGDSVGVQVFYFVDFFFVFGTPDAQGAVEVAGDYFGFCREIVDGEACGGAWEGFGGDAFYEVP